MAAKRKGVRQISEIANGMLDPILSRRAGISTLLIGSWDEIAGEQFSDCTRPEQIKWPRRQPVSGEGGFAPGVLTIACEGARALFLMHAEGELIQRINAFFGYPAVDRLRIVQKPVSAGPHRPRQRSLSPDAAERLAEMLREVEDPRLKASLERLGRGVLAGRARS